VPLPFSLFAAVLLLPSQMQVSFESRIAANGDGEAVLTNRSDSTVTAYVFEIFREPCNPIEADRHVFAGCDGALTPDSHGIRPSASRTQDIGASHCNKAGVHSPATAVLKAALFADGSTFGDERWVKALVENRQFQLRKIDETIRVLKELKPAQTREDYVAVLRKTQASSPPSQEPRIEFYGAADPYETAIHQLTEKITEPLKNRVADLLIALQAQRNKIQNELQSSP
jgi:hypothetical protein